MSVDIRGLVDAGVHFGHQKSRWCPKMKLYIWGIRNNTHLIDIAKTASQIELATKFLSDITSQGKQILFIGTKRSAQDIIKAAATQTKMPYVNHRWIGGTLSNYIQVKKSLTKLLHLEDVLAKSKEAQFYTKKELNIFQKMVDRLDRYVGGLRSLRFADLGAIVVVDIDKERSAVLEAAFMGIPIVALVDTNADPSLIDIVVPANDDSPKSIAAVMRYLEQAVQSGITLFEKAKAEKKISVKTELEKPQEPSDTTSAIAAASFGDDITEEEGTTKDDLSVQKKKPLRTTSPAGKPSIGKPSSGKHGIAHKGGKPDFVKSTVKQKK
jgi:small subunit ribosomal protein S2